MRTSKNAVRRIVSDFGLNDAIESGLVKTPRVVIRDDGKLSKDYRSRLYHIYMDRGVVRKFRPDFLVRLSNTSHWFSR